MVPKAAQLTSIDSPTKRDAKLPRRGQPVAPTPLQKAVCLESYRSMRGGVPGLGRLPLHGAAWLYRRVRFGGCRAAVQRGGVWRAPEATGGWPAFVVADCTR